MTQTRGSADTVVAVPASGAAAGTAAATVAGGPSVGWMPVESGMRPIVITLLLAFMVHFGPPILVNASHLMSWLGMAIVGDDEDDDDDAVQEVLVPIDLDMFYEEVKEQDGVDIAPEPAPVAPEPAPEEVIVVPTPKPVEESAPPPAPKPEEKPVEEPPEPEEKPQAKQRRRLQGAFDAASDNNLARAEHPNVNIYIATKVLRQRKLAAGFGELLNTLPEWQLLLGGTKLDPVADFDHVLISAPHMKKKGRWIVARVGYNIADERMKEAVGIAAKRSNGKWLEEDYKLPVASVDNDTRRVVLIEKRDQFVVLPKDAEKQIPKLAGVGSFPKKPSAGIFIDMVTPANAIKSRGIDFPESIEKLTLRLSLAPNNGYLVEIEMIDSDEASAKKNAALLDDKLEELRPIPLVSLFSKKYFFGKAEFETDGEIIRVTAPVSHVQVERIMKLVRVWLDGREADAKSKKKKKKKKPKKAAKKPKKRLRAKAGSKRKAAPKKKKKKSTSILDGMRDRMSQ